MVGKQRCGHSDSAQWSIQIAVELQGTVEAAKNDDSVLRLHAIHDPIVLMKKDSGVDILVFQSGAQSRVVLQKLGLTNNGLHRVRSGTWIIQGDMFVDCL